MNRNEKVPHEIKNNKLFTVNEKEAVGSVPLADSTHSDSEEISHSTYDCQSHLH